jgi:hypothetical protein
MSMGLSGLAPIFAYRIAQYISLIYLARRWQQGARAHQQGVSSRSQETTMNTSTKIALAAALILGAASAARANDIETNPSGAQSEREWQEFMGQGQKHRGNSAASYGYSSPTQDDVSQSGRKNRNH